MNLGMFLGFSWWAWTLFAIGWLIALLAAWAPKVHMYLLRAINLSVLGIGVFSFNIVMKQHGLFTNESTFLTQMITISPFILLWVVGIMLSTVCCPIKRLTIDVAKKSIQLERSFMPLMACGVFTALEVFYAYGQIFLLIDLQQYWYYFFSCTIVWISFMVSFINRHIGRYDQDCMRRARKSG